MARYRPEVGKWYRKVSFRRDLQRWDNTYVLEVININVHKKPAQATVMRRGENYRGMWFKAYIKLPVWIESWR